MVKLLKPNAKELIAKPDSIYASLYQAQLS